MSLRKKTLMMTGMTFAGLIVILYAVSRISLLGDFAELEKSYIRQNLGRALGALARELTALESVALDWAAWDDTYAFMADRNNRYLESNIVDGTFTALNLNLMVFVNESGKIVFGQGFDLVDGNQTRVPPAFEEHLTENGVLVRRAQSGGKVTGIILLSEAPMLVASHPVLTSEEKGPVRGSLIMGRYLDAAKIRHLAETTKLSLSVHRAEARELPPDVRRPTSTLSQQVPTMVQPLSDESIAGYALLKDISGRPVLVLKVDMRRDIYRHAQAAISYFVVALIGVGAVFCVVIMSLLERQVLSRLIGLGKSVKSIGRSPDIFGRVPVTGNDEITDLAAEIDGMLECRRHAENALHMSEARYRTVFNTTGTATVITEEDMTISMANAEFERLSGYLRKEIEGKRKWTEFVAKDHLEMMKRYHTRRRESRDNVPTEYEFRFVDKKGDTKNIFVKVAIIPGTKRSIASLMDITARKRAEEALRESEEKYRLLVEHANDAIFIAQDEVIKFPNPKTRQVTGYSEEELARTSFVKLIHPEDREMVLERYQKRLQGHELPNTYAFRIINRAGKELWVQINAVLITWQGRPATLSFVRDITPQKQLEAQLLQAKKMEAVGRLAGGIAHHCNNILGIVIGNVELAMDIVSEHDPVRENLIEVQQASLRAKHLVRQLLGISGHPLQEWKPLELDGLVNESVNFLQPSTPTNVQIFKTIASESNTVMADATQLMQVLTNLYANAVQAMGDKGGMLDVTLRNVECRSRNVNPNGDEPRCQIHDQQPEIDCVHIKPGPYVELTVSDTGLGIDAEIMPRIFDPCFTTRGDTGHAGMGLAVVHGIVRKHGGVIRANSEPGKGATFQIFLPIIEEEAGCAPEKLLGAQENKEKWKAISTKAYLAI